MIKKIFFQKNANFLLIFSIENFFYNYKKKNSKNEKFSALLKKFFF